MKSVSIGICGLGTVGCGTVNVLNRNSQEIRDRLGCEISISQVGSRRDSEDCDLTGISFSRDIFTVAENPDIDISFCVTWANESWTRAWTGNPEVFLQKQLHTDDKTIWKKHFDYLYVRNWVYCNNVN